MNAISVPIAEQEQSRATGAYIAFLAFIVTVYSSIAQLLPPLEKIAAELGIPAVAVFCTAIIAAMLALGRAAKRKKMGSLTPVARGLQIAIFGFVVCSLTGGYVFTWPIYFLFGIAAAVHLRAQAPAAR